jgi:chaperonin GroES
MIYIDMLEDKAHETSALSRRECQFTNFPQKDSRKLPPGAGATALESRYMNFRPLHDRVAVCRVDSETKTSGGIIIPDTAAEKPQQGEVIAVGPGARNEDGKVIPVEVKKGDRVLFGKWSGTEVKIDGAEILIMKESDIMGVIAN